MNLKFILCLLFLLCSGGFVACSANDILAEYRVRPGDTLSQIAEKQGLKTVIIQKLNNIQNPDNIQTGMNLMIPTVDWLVGPFLKSGEKPLPYVYQVGCLNRTNVVVWVDVVHTNGGRFLGVTLSGTNRTLAFNSGAFDSALLSGADYWSFIDLDGDGDSDILLEHTEGAGCFLTLYAFHFDGKSYRQKLLVNDDIAIGCVEHHRKKNGVAVMDIYERWTGKHTAIDWEQMKDSPATNQAAAVLSQ